MGCEVGAEWRGGGGARPRWLTGTEPDRHGSASLISSGWGTRSLALFLPSQFASNLRLLLPPVMPVPQLPPELIYHILSLLPLVSRGGPLAPAPERTEALLSCSLVKKTFCKAVQVELGKHLSWGAPKAGKIEAFLRSPSCPERWVCESIWMSSVRVEEVAAVFARAASIQGLTLLLVKPEFEDYERFMWKPVCALGSLAGQSSLIQPSAVP